MHHFNSIPFVFHRIFHIYSIEHVVLLMSQLVSPYVCSCPCSYHVNQCKCFCPYHEARSVVYPITPEYYSSTDFPSLPINGWFKPCRYPDCFIITSERITIDAIRYPCCRNCKKRDDCSSKLKYSRYYNMIPKSPLAQEATNANPK